MSSTKFIAVVQRHIKDMAQEVNKTDATDQMVVLATKPSNTTTSHTHSFASLFGRYRNSGDSLTSACSKRCALLYALSL